MIPAVSNIIIDTRNICWNVVIEWLTLSIYQSVIALCFYLVSGYHIFEKETIHRKKLHITELGIH